MKCEPLWWLLFVLAFLLTKFTIIDSMHAKVWANQTLHSERGLLPGPQTHCSNKQVWMGLSLILHPFELQAFVWHYIFSTTKIFCPNWGKQDVKIWRQKSKFDVGCLNDLKFAILIPYWEFLMVFSAFIVISHLHIDHMMAVRLYIHIKMGGICLQENNIQFTNYGLWVNRSKSSHNMM